MKIENPLSSQVSTGAAAQTGGVTQAQSGAGGRNRAEGYSDRVQLSNLSEALRDLAVEDPDRAAQVEQIGQVVQAGSYQVDPLQLSAKIIGESVAIS